MFNISTIAKKIKQHNLINEFKVVGQFFYANSIAYILLYIQNIIINRYMPTESLGAFSYIQSILLLLSSVYSLDVYAAYLRYVGYREEKTLVTLVRKILLLATILFGISVYILYQRPLYALFAGYMWMFERLYFFRAQYNIKVYGRIKIFQYLISNAIAILLVITKHFNEHTMITCIGLSYIFIAFAYNFFKGNRKCNLDDSTLPIVTINEVLRYSSPLAFNAIIVWLLGSADQILISRFLDPITLTFYAISFRIINIIRLGISPIMEYWPRFYYEHMNSCDYVSVKTMSMFFHSVTVILCIGSILFCKQIYWVMGASKYSETCWMFCMLAIAEICRIGASINLTYQSFVNNTYINVILLSVLCSLKFVINWYVIQETGVIILFYTTIACYFLYYICSLYWGRYQERKYIFKIKLETEMNKHKEGE